MIKLYYTYPENWTKRTQTTSFYLLITETYYRIFWDKISFFQFITLKLNKQFEVVEFYEIIGGKNVESYPLNCDQRRQEFIIEIIKYVLKNPDEAEKVNPEQLLTHRNPYIRNIIKAELSND